MKILQNKPKFKLYSMAILLLSMFFNCVSMQEEDSIKFSPENFKIYEKSVGVSYASILLTKYKSNTVEKCDVLIDLATSILEDIGDGEHELLQNLKHHIESYKKHIVLCRDELTTLQALRAAQQALQHVEFQQPIQQSQGCCTIS